MAEAVQAALLKRPAENAEASAAGGGEAKRVSRPVGVSSMMALPFENDDDSSDDEDVGEGESNV